MKDIFELESHTKISLENSYIISYPHILAFFQSHNSFKEHDFVCCAHIVYGWMPTILDLAPNESSISIKIGAELLSKAKQVGSISDKDIEQLMGLVNNSLVGVSKLLHFTAPNNFAIWDSKIYSFVFEERPHNYRVNQISKYRNYLSQLDKIKLRYSFPLFHSSINKKLGYEVTPLRAIELVMFLNAN